MTPIETKQRVRNVVAQALRIDPGSIADEASQMNLQEWDSVRHMNVVLGLENEFGIEFADEELQTLTSMSAMIMAIERHLIS